MSISTDTAGPLVESAPSPGRTWLKSLAGRRWFRRLVVWSFLAAVYQVVAYIVGPFYLPTLQAIIGGAIDLGRDGSLTTMASALVQMVIGFALSIVVGIPLGVAMGASRLVDYVLGFYVKGMFVTSLIAVLPLLIIVFGFGLAYRVSVVFLFAVFFIILNTAAGVRDVDPQLVAMGRAFGASRWRRAATITLPSALPFAIAGIRIGLANAFGGMILAELWIARDFGQIMLGLAYNRDLPKFLALLVIVTLLASFSAAGLKAFEKWLTPWSRSTRDR
ncbi:MAG TPA: ABC transporter permease subunit [Acidothermaceae bacterium]|jgi:ABC-type nitrate/sulfonate/bicarbonate transport system permease component